MKTYDTFDVAFSDPTTKGSRPEKRINCNVCTKRYFNQIYTLLYYIPERSGSRGQHSIMPASREKRGRGIGEE